MEPCVICGHHKAHGAHVKAREWFGDPLPPNNREQNIIPLCPNHHDAFDRDHTIGITPDKQGFVVLEGDTTRYYRSQRSIEFLRDDYVAERNASCVKTIRLALGVIRGYEGRRIW